MGEGNRRAWSSDTSASIRRSSEMPTNASPSCAMNGVGLGTVGRYATIAVDFTATRRRTSPSIWTGSKSSSGPLAAMSVNGDS